MNEAEIEVGVMSYKNGPLALVYSDLMAHFAEQTPDSLILWMGDSQGVEGINAVHLQRFGIELAAGKRSQMQAQRSRRVQPILAVSTQEYGRNLKQCVPFGVKTTRFDINDHGQKSAEPMGHRLIFFGQGRVLHHHGFRLSERKCSAPTRHSTLKTQSRMDSD